MLLFDLFFPQFCKIWYVEVRISESRLDFEITRVDCIFSISIGVLLLTFETSQWNIYYQKDCNETKQKAQWNKNTHTKKKKKKKKKSKRHPYIISICLPAWRSDVPSVARTTHVANKYPWSQKWRSSHWGFAVFGGHVFVCGFTVHVMPFSWASFYIIVLPFLYILCTQLPSLEAVASRNFIKETYKHQLNVCNDFFKPSHWNEESQWMNDLHTYMYEQRKLFSKYAKFTDSDSPTWVYAAHCHIYGVPRVRM